MELRKCLPNFRRTPITSGSSKTFSSDPTPRHVKTNCTRRLGSPFPISLVLQEVSTEREIEIPGEVRQIYAQWRPSPLFRARRLAKALDTPARIYCKYEGGSSPDSHKLNTAVA